MNENVEGVGLMMTFVLCFGAALAAAVWLAHDGHVFLAFCVILAGASLRVNHSDDKKTEESPAPAEPKC